MIKRLMLLALSACALLVSGTYALAQCVACPKVCVAWSLEPKDMPNRPHHPRQCLAHGRSINCQREHEECKGELERKLKCVAGALHSKPLTGACAACVGGTEGADITACAAPICIETDKALSDAEKDCR